MSAEAFSQPAETTRPDAAPDAAPVSAETLAAAEGKPPRKGRADKAEPADKADKQTPMMQQYL